MEKNERVRNFLDAGAAKEIRRILAQETPWGLSFQAGEHGKPEQLRVAHLPSIHTPVLIIQGERDAFGTPDELRPHLNAMRAEVQLHVIPRADHSLAVRGRAMAETDAELADIVARFIGG